MKYYNCDEWFLWARVFTYRRDAIDYYNRFQGDPNAYRRERRRGIVKAVRVTISETETTPANNGQTKEGN
jgi:hypothetical protein